MVKSGHPDLWVSETKCEEVKSDQNLKVGRAKAFLKKQLVCPLWQHYDGLYE